MNASAAVADDLDAVIGERVHMLMFRRRMSGRALARSLDITPSVLSKKLRGTSGWSARHVAIAAAALRTTVGELYGELPPSTGPDNVPTSGPLAQSAELRTFNPSSAVSSLATARRRRQGLAKPSAA